MGFLQHPIGDGRHFARLLAIFSGSLFGRTNFGRVTTLAGPSQRKRIPFPYTMFHVPFQLSVFAGLTPVGRKGRLHQSEILNSWQLIRGHRSHTDNNRGSTATILRRTTLPAPSILDGFPVVPACQSAFSALLRNATVPKMCTA